MAPTTHNENLFNRQGVAIRRKVPGRWSEGWYSAAQPNIIKLVFDAADVYARNFGKQPLGIKEGG